MPVNPALAITIPASSPLYRITAISFHTPNPVHHKKVVNGMGARKSHNGARYNFGGVLTVYLADTVETCLAEKMFYYPGTEEAHTNPTRQRGECLRAIAGASG